MNIHYLQHVPFETPERILNWAEEKGHKLSSTLLFREVAFPPHSDYDLLIVMGGPMGTYDKDQYDFLEPEKAFIKEAIDRRKPILGICLGAQLLAEAIGGRVYRNEHKEIGWFDVTLLPEATQNPFFRHFPNSITPFHWHGDTFELPPEAEVMASSEGCINQAFVYGGHAVGLQFHLESSDSSIRELIVHSASDLAPGTYVQQPAEMEGRHDLLENSHAALRCLMESFAELVRNGNSNADSIEDAIRDDAKVQRSGEA